MTTPTTDALYHYRADVGLAAQHVADLSAEMVGLDMQPGTIVTVVDYDHDRDLVVVDWIDAQGNPRITSVAPELFARDFAKE